jgi:hypothetical protein
VCLICIDPPTHTQPETSLPQGKVGCSLPAVRTLLSDDSSSLSWKQPDCPFKVPGAIKLSGHDEQDTCELILVWRTSSRVLFPLPASSILECFSTTLHRDPQPPCYSLIHHKLGSRWKGEILILQYGEFSKT